LVVTLSQASCYLRHPNIDEGGKQFLKRELGGELVSVLYSERFKNLLVSSSSTREQFLGKTITGK